MKYDLIIDGAIVIPDQTFHDGKTDVEARVVLDEIRRRIRGGGSGDGMRSISGPGSSAVLICWDRVTTIEVRKHGEPPRESLAPLLNRAAYLPLPAGLDLTPAQVRDLQRSVRQLVADLAQMEPDPDRKVIVLPPGAFIPGEIYAGMQSEAEGPA
jgi:hypothetical protein